MLKKTKKKDPFMKLLLKKSMYCLLIISISAIFCTIEALPMTSVTDHDEAYRQLCAQASSDQQIFDMFRRSAACQRVIEAVSPNDGLECIKIIQRQSPEFLTTHLADFKTSDKVGNPLMCLYPDVGEFSPTTLRYIKIASDLKKFFGDLDNCTIVEIGGGYGGQCKIINDVCKVKHYIIIDLPEPLALTKKFLEHHGIYNVTYLTPDQPLPNQVFDLAISNYAFSELTESSRKKYIKDVLNFSKRGYLLCNDATGMSQSGNLFAYKKKLVNEIASANISPEIYAECPLTCASNYLVVWGHLNS